MWKWPSVIAIAAVAAVVGLALRLTALTPSRAAPESDLINSIGMAFVLIPAGEFMMGTPEAQLDAIAGDDAWYRATWQRETPPQRVVIAHPFYMGKYEVTQAQWQAAMGQNPSRFPGDDRPVENVSWQDVQIFKVLEEFAAFP